MSEFVLQDTKKVLGIAADYEHFDEDILVFINSAFGNLFQLGALPNQHLKTVSAVSKWEDFFDSGSPLGLVQSYVYMKVRKSFDPPTTSFHLEAITNAIEEYEWRINVECEGSFEPREVIDEGNTEGGMTDVF